MMKWPLPHSTALALALLTAGADVAFAQTSAKGGGANLTVSVTVSPICTVAVAAGEAVDVQCRNLAENQPEPIVDDSTQPIADDRGASSDAIPMVVINF